MVTTKNQKSNKTHAKSAKSTPKSAKSRTSSTKIHAKRPAVKSSHLAKSKDTNRKIYAYSRRAILTVIALAMMAVILMLLFTSLSTPERVIARKVEEITKDYYENYFYDRLGQYETEKRPAAEILERYETTGFARVSLRQLLYFDDDRHIAALSTFENYCDLDATSVQIYPDAPFGRTDYHVEYFYSCAF